MKEERKNSIDNLFLKSLDGHKIEPSSGVWESLDQYIPSASGRGTIYFLVSAILIGAFSLFYHTGINTYPPAQTDAMNTEAEGISVSPPDEDPIRTDQTPPSASTSGSAQAKESASAEGNLSVSSANDAYIQKNATGTTTSIPPITSSDPEPKANVVPESSNSTETDKKTLVEILGLDKLNPKTNSLDVNTSRSLASDESRDSGKPVFDLSMRDSYAKKADFKLGAGLSPAVNIYPDGQNRNDYSLEVVAAVERSRFILEGGIGGNYSTESAKYEINYTSYDSIGYYINVNSFSIDPDNPDSLILETSLKSIYDSIDHIRIEENTNKYVYLQLPVRLGYRVLQTNRLSLDVKLGVLFSVQLYKDIPGSTFQASDAENLEVTRQYPDRLKTNWQYTAGIGLNYQVSKNINLYLEPYYRQYINSVYSPNSSYSARSPYAFGIRGGIYIHF